MSGDRERTWTSITGCLGPRFYSSLMLACTRPQMVSLSYDSSLSQTVGADLTSLQTR